jgi:hypothetical protein
LRLSIAVKEAFPAGGMTVSGLRREAARGRLAIEVIAGEQFTTLAAIARMRELCRKNASPAAHKERDQERPISPARDAAILAQVALRSRLKIKAPGRRRRTPTDLKNDLKDA